MAYTNIETYGSRFKRIKSLEILGVPFGPVLPTPDAEDGFPVFIHTDNNFDNGVWKWWDGSDWNVLNGQGRYGNIDGGSANSIYLSSQVIDGGGAIL